MSGLMASLDSGVESRLARSEGIEVVHTLPSADPKQNNLSPLFDYARVAASALKDLANSTHIPFLLIVAEGSLSIFNAVQSTKANKELCLRIVSQIHNLHCAIISICFSSEGILSVRIVEIIGQFAGTLQKIQISLRSQQQLGKIKRFFKHSEITAQLAKSETELQSALDVISVGATL
ncbi:hypothetical protein B0H10DRAFT_2219790 [Mycena sp. CBHHK59/15]|nr:hypothetical protein B0H10DRAFT_2219790 [Mycena sp. CBHHK59/15]